MLTDKIDRLLRDLFFYPYAYKGLRFCFIENVYITMLFNSISENAYQPLGSPSSLKDSSNFFYYSANK